MKLPVIYMMIIQPSFPLPPSLPPFLPPTLPPSDPPFLSLPPSLPPTLSPSDPLSHTQRAIILGAGATPLTEYESFVYYHNNTPKWNETFKVCR